LMLQNEIYTKDRQKFLGQEVEVLVEMRSMKDANKLKGRTRCWKNVIFSGDDAQIGSLQKVQIHSFMNQTLIGEVVSESKIPIIA
jgi:tRNA-2-methylthio-N6-dimethylallyladenosine synthase